VNLSIQSEDIVPLYFKKLMWTVITILAVLKASAAFVLLNLTQLISRLRTIIKLMLAKLAISLKKNLQRARELDL
jgi:acyl-coenzyme A synthetase/AMP-(fatty) acid ligase